jgi:hypothetical protein
MCGRNCQMPRSAVILHLLRGRTPNERQKLPLPVVDAAVVDLCRVSHKRLEHFVRGGKCNSSNWPHAKCCMVAASVDEDPLVSGSGRQPAEQNWLAMHSSAGATSLPIRSLSYFRVGPLRVVCANASSAIALVHGATGGRACYAPRWTIKWRSECHNGHQCALGNKQVLMQSSHISIAVQAKPCQHH